MSNLTIRKFQRISSERNKIAFPECKDWGPVDWGNATAGEIGEACNLIKKLKLSRTKAPEKTALHNHIIKSIGFELADTLSYLVLIADSLSIDLESFTVDKFNTLSTHMQTIKIAE